MSLKERVKGELMHSTAQEVVVDIAQLYQMAVSIIFDKSAIYNTDLGQVFLGLVDILEIIINQRWQNEVSLPELGIARCVTNFCAGFSNTYREIHD